MFLFRKPSPAAIQSLLKTQQGKDFSYTELGATKKHECPPGYRPNHLRLKIGEGREAYQRAVKALNELENLKLSWCQFHSSEDRLVGGATIAICAQHFGFHSINFSRILEVYEDEVRESDGKLKLRFGYIYGTLSSHDLIGEEQFLVEFNEETQEVIYDIFSFSKLRTLFTRLGAPMGRLLQRRFVRESGEVVKQYIHSHHE